MCKNLAEFLGCFVLVFGGCGSAILAAGVPDVGIGYLGVSLAFGLTVLCMAYAVGGISGGHFNPAVTIGLVVAKRFDSKEAVGYIIAQVLAAIVAAVILYAIVAGGSLGAVDSVLNGGIAANGYGEHSPSGYNMVSALLIEVILTAVFLIVILGATSDKVPSGFAPIPIGLTLTLIHLISIPVTNTSVNPARSTGPAVVSALKGVNWPVEQLWLFWVAPIVGAILGALIWNMLQKKQA